MYIDKNKFIIREMFQVRIMDLYTHCHVQRLSTGPRKGRIQFYFFLHIK